MENRSLASAMKQFGRLMGLWCCLVCSTTDAQQRFAAASRAWEKTNNASPSYFVPMGEKQWIETNAEGMKIPFVEVDSPRGTVELYDAGRKLRIRLHARYAELSTNDRPFQRWVEGRWVSKERLPEYAQLAAVDHRVRLIYFVAKDRQPTSEYQAKIRVVMNFANSLYRYEFRRRGWPDRGLQFELDEQGAPVVHMLRGEHEAAYYSASPNFRAGQQFERLPPEIPSKIGNPASHLIVAFMETYDADLHPFEWPGGVALGGRFSADGGLAVFSAWILRDEFCATTAQRQMELFRDATPIKGRTALGYGRVDSPRFEFIEDGFGAVMHEVGHALGLPHDQRDDSHYIMANGFRRLRVNLDQETPIERRARFSDANANILRVSRHLSSQSNLDDRQPPVIQANIEAVLSDRSYRLKITATDDEGLACWQCIDAESGGVVDGGSLEGVESTWEVEVTLAKVPPTGKPLLHVHAIDQGGNRGTFSLMRD